MPAASHSVGASHLSLVTLGFGVGLDRKRAMSEIMGVGEAPLAAERTEMTNAQNMDAQIYFRSANAADFDYCANLYFAGMEKTMCELGLDARRQLTNFRQRWAAGETRIIVREGMDVGWVQSRIEGDSIFVAQLFVERSWQGRGTGTHVMACILDEAARAGRGVTLGVVKTNPALRLYERLGFRTTHEDDRKFYLGLRR
jgi:GNAT superfamily N-acetyltransferase